MKHVGSQNLIEESKRIERENGAILTFINDNEIPTDEYSMLEIVRNIKTKIEGILNRGVTIEHRSTESDILTFYCYLDEEIQEDLRGDIEKAICRLIHQSATIIRIHKPPLIPIETFELLNKSFIRKEVEKFFDLPMTICMLEDQNKFIKQFFIYFEGYGGLDMSKRF